MIKRLTLADARRMVRELGCSISHNHVTGEYRVNLKDGKEATAYYTSDIDDAVATARQMAQHHTHKSDCRRG